MGTSERHEWQVEQRTGDERNVVIQYTCSCGRGHGEMRHAKRKPHVQWIGGTRKVPPHTRG